MYLFLECYIQSFPTINIRSHCTIQDIIKDGLLGFSTQRNNCVFLFGLQLIIPDCAIGACCDSPESVLEPPGCLCTSLVKPSTNTPDTDTLGVPRLIHEFQPLSPPPLLGSPFFFFLCLLYRSSTLLSLPSL